jgi:integrase
MTSCPTCGNSTVYNNGKRTLSNGRESQRLLCAKCGQRFSETYLRFVGQKSNRQLCASEKAKKLDNATKINIVAGDGKTNLKGKIIGYSFMMEKQGYAEATIRLNSTCLRILMERGADLSDPESVKETLANQKSWSQNRRRNAINAYSQFLQFIGRTWEPPRCNVIRKIPFIPAEQEIDDLIAGCPNVVATMLQLLKETAMRSGEAISLQWKDVDFQRRIIMLNTPEKGSDPRIFNKLTGKLLSMLNALPRTNDYVFGQSSLNSLKATYSRARKRLAVKLQNPRLKEIHFHSLRHWAATMEYHHTKDLLHVKAFLGHKEVDNTMLYIQLDKQLFQNVPDDNFITRVANSTEEACKLIDVGYEYVTGEYNDGGKIFRKHK